MEGESDRRCENLNIKLRSPPYARPLTNAYSNSNYVNNDFGCVEEPASGGKSNQKRTG